jgi:hypothetical protein
MEKPTMTVLILACITTVATLSYGLATFLLWWENRQDRKQRQKQFVDEQIARKRDELYRAFYEAHGYWNGQAYRAPHSPMDSSQSGRLFETLIRLECQLRLNAYTKEANDFGFAVRMLEGIDEQLSQVGMALGLITSEYRKPIIVKTTNPSA